MIKTRLVVKKKTNYRVSTIYSMTRANYGKAKTPEFKTYLNSSYTKEKGITHSKVNIYLNNIISNTYLNEGIYG